MISKAARRYSLALYGLAEEKSSLQELAKDFEFIKDMLSKSRELQLFFNNPSINKSVKTAAVKELFSGKAGNITMNFILLLIKRGRENLIGDITEDFLKLKKEKEGVLEVRVRTTIDLDDKERAEMTNRINSYTGKKSDITYSIDKEIIGGFVASVGDTVLDASIKRQLELLKEQFKSGEYSVN